MGVKEKKKKVFKTFYFILFFVLLKKIIITSFFFFFFFFNFEKKREIKEKQVRTFCGRVRGSGLKTVLLCMQRQPGLESNWVKDCMEGLHSNTFLNFLSYPMERQC